MQIKFNKLVKPVSPQMDELKQGENKPAAPKTAEMTQPSGQVPPVMTPPVQTSPFASSAEKGEAKKPAAAPAPKTAPAPATEPAPAVAPAVPTTPAPAAAPAPAPTAPAPAPAPAPAYAAPAPVQAPRSIGRRIEETLRECIGQTIRVYMSDHEYVSGRLELVEDGWIKLSNARSAGSEYYSDEDVINTANLVRVRYSKVIEKSTYVEFMNSSTK